MVQTPGRNMEKNALTPRQAERMVQTPGRNMEKNALTPRQAERMVQTPGRNMEKNALTPRHTEMALTPGRKRGRSVEINQSPKLGPRSIFMTSTSASSRTSIHVKNKINFQLGYEQPR